MDDITSTTLPRDPGYNAADIDTKDEIDLAHIETVREMGTEASNEKWNLVNVEAARAEEFEHSLGFWRSIRMYKMAVLWSFIASLSIIMEGYDTSVGGGASLYEYRKYFGTYDATLDDYQLTAGWQGALQQSGNIGNILGIAMGTFLIDRFGYKKSLIANYIVIIPFIAINAFAQNKVMLLMGGILCGIPWGVFSTLGEAYASEICPLSLRAYLTGWLNVCWVLGGFVASGITYATQSIASQWSFRIPYATQWVWPIPLILFMSFAPESPWWLVRHGKLQQAETSVRRLGPKDRRELAHEQVANMVRTNQMELQFNKTGQESRWVELFRKTDLRRTEITCITFIIQNACGVIFVGGTVYVFEQAGISQTKSFQFGLGNSALQLVANFFNFWLLHLAGRRTIMLLGFGILDTLLVVIGILAVLGDKGNDNAKWGQAAVTLVYNMCYTGFIGPVTYSIVGEASSTRLRNKTIGLARAVYILYSLIMYLLQPYMINPTAWNWQGKTAFFWVPWCTASFIWIYYRLPEFKHRSFYELDILFHRKVPARKFKEQTVERDAIDQEIAAA